MLICALRNLAQVLLSIPAESTGLIMFVMPPKSTISLAWTVKIVQLLATHAYDKSGIVQLSGVVDAIPSYGGHDQKWVSVLLAGKPKSWKEGIGLTVTKTAAFRALTLDALSNLSKRDVVLSMRCNMSEKTREYKSSYRFFCFIPLSNNIIQHHQYQTYQTYSNFIKLFRNSSFGFWWFLSRTGVATLSQQRG